MGDHYRRYHAEHGTVRSGHEDIPAQDFAAVEPPATVSRVVSDEIVVSPFAGKPHRWQAVRQARIDIAMGV